MNVRATSFAASRLLATLLLATASSLFVAMPATAQQRPRAIVLSFEGWHADQARAAVADALATQFDLVTEEQAINAAAQIAVDVSTPEGMAAVVSHLGIELVVGGSVAGTGRRSSTTIFVLDRNGNELGNAQAPGPTGRAAVGPIGQAALQACNTAWMTLHPPEPVVVEQQPPPVEEQPPPREDEPPMRSLEDIENETAGASRGQGGSSGGFDDDRAAGPTDHRWNQPVFRGFLFVDLRNRAARVVPFEEGNVSPTNDAGFFPQWGADLELRPLANNDDALRGLYARVATSFSIAINYFSWADEELPLQTFGFEIDLGYAFTIEEVFELILNTGFGYDVYQLQLAQNIVENDFPSTAYPYLPIQVGGRVRLLPSSVSDVDLHLEAMGGPRIVLGGGQLAGTSDSTDPETAAYFASRMLGACGNPSLRCDGDFGGVLGAAVHFYAGLGVSIDPGFSAAFRFAYTNYFLGFSGGTGTRGAISGNDESLHFQIMVGWSVR